MAVGFQMHNSPMYNSMYVDLIRVIFICTKHIQASAI